LETTVSRRQAGIETHWMAKERIIISVAERQLRRRARRAALWGFIAGIVVGVLLAISLR
tara:strand:- start:1013 stop:1189 length:177 start_codon:yes stop_codon:yes gene_type:complete